MRWPLKNQILIRVLPLLIATITAITIANVRVTTELNRSQQEQRIQRIADMLTASRFPLTSNVLDQMKLLSDAEFVVVTADGTIAAKSKDAPPDLSVVKAADAVAGKIDLEERVTIDEHDWFYAKVMVPNRRSNRPEMSDSVHVFVSQDDFHELWWRGIRMPLIVAGIVLPLAIVISLAMASHLARPLVQVREQVQQIAGGEIREIPSTNRNDEINNLVTSFNEMAVRLKDHEEKTRQNVRLSTLLQMGTAIAHNLKNCVTGSKMAVELLAAEHQAVANSENLKVALRQFKLMQQYIDRFLSIGQSGKQPVAADSTTIDLGEVLNDVVYLLKPMAGHLKVDLRFSRDSHPINAKMVREDAEQLMTNLITNAIEAASEQAVARSDNSAWVRVELKLDGKNRIHFSVTDNGAGPPDEISARMFEPFVTGKQEGTGLGLPLVNEIASSQDGEVKWERTDETTQFTVTFQSKAIDKNLEQHK